MAIQHSWVRKVHSSRDDNDKLSHDETHVIFRAMHPAGMTPSGYFTFAAGLWSMMFAAMILIIVLYLDRVVELHGSLAALA